jgi:hypothetical protein
MLFQQFQVMDFEHSLFQVSRAMIQTSCIFYRIVNGPTHSEYRYFALHARLTDFFTC